MEKTKKIKQILMGACLGIMFIFTITIAIRVFTRQVLIVHFGMDNAFTRLVFWDDDEMAGIEIEETATDSYDYDWSVDYPFAGEADDEQVTETSDDTSALEHYSDIVEAVEDRVENYTQDHLVGYSTLTWLGNKYKSLIGWNFASFSEYNGTFQLTDGYWTSLNEAVDQTEHAENLAVLRDFCEAQDMDFLYVQLPHKISEYEDADISGSVDFTNQNADQLLDLASEYEITTLDIRDSILEAGFSHHSLFYVTDHHWKAETGFWATGIVAEFINDQYGYHLDLSKLDAENYSAVYYTESFMGSYGTKVTTANATPDDFTMLYPDFETLLHFSVPSMDIDVTGDFSVTYNMDAEGEYGAYGYGDHALIQYENLIDDVEDKKILVIHDSFANSVIPFLALTVSEIDAIDLRYFNGSLETYINETKPDMVIVMRYAGELATVRDLATHADSFDFR